MRATWFAPSRPRAVIAINCATAVPRGFYFAFARFAAERGAAVVTYDYRGVGDPPAALRKSPARMRDWAELDMPGVLDDAERRYPGLPLNVVGHSFGGQALLLAPGNDRIARAIAVAAMAASWRDMALPERYAIFLSMKFVVPLVTGVCGYFPGTSVGFGEDMAPGILREWGHWCMLPNYLFSDRTLTSLKNVSTYRAPTLILSMRDDPWVRRRGVARFAREIAGAHVEQRLLDPRVYGIRQLGHLGFFRSTNGAQLWPQAMEFLGL